MQNHIRLFALTFYLALPPIVVAETAIAVERKVKGEATKEFRFLEIDAPVDGDAGQRGHWSVISGTVDSVAGGLEKLNDGQLPPSSDQPSENFFFAPGTDGGRLLLELTHLVSLAEIRTYSWHPGERSGQVYTVYGCDPFNDDGVQLKPSATTDPTTCGWTQIASVDTRRANVDRRLRPSAVGGQVGVQISADETEVGEDLGHYRYLLFDIKRTRPGARFSNTFYSEIDVLEEGASVTPATPVATQGITTYEIEGGKYEFTLDTSECPDLTPWSENELAPIVQNWYPKIVELLAGDNYEAPQNFRIRISSTMDGVAATSGTTVNCSASWYRRNLQGEAGGATVHELVHVVQQYGNARRTNRQATRTPGWVVEGIADYVRWHLYEPASAGGGVSRRRPASLKYNASYRDTGAFLAWVIDNGHPDLLSKLNAAARTGTYSAAFWKETTGKTAEDLSAAWHADLEK